MDCKVELLLLASLEELISIEVDYQRQLNRYCGSTAGRDGLICGLETAIDIIHSFSSRYQSNLQDFSSRK